MPFSRKCVILGELRLNHRENEEWEAFFQYNDIALPLSYLISSGIAVPSGDQEAEHFVEETWRMFCRALGIDHRESYRDLADAIDVADGRGGAIVAS